MKPIGLVFSIIFGPSVLGCSSVFYYPDQVQYVDPEKLPIRPEDLEIPARDGHMIPAWYFKAKDGKSKGLIIQFHGNAQNLTSHFAFLSSAPHNGYDHLIFDYRGYGKSPGKPTPKNTVQDGMDVIRWAKANFPDLPIIVFGQSLGGAVSLKALIELRDEFKADAIVIDSGFSSYRSVARSVLANHWLTWLLQPIGWLIVDNSMGPGKDISKLEPTPFLVVHGTKDPIVAFSHGQGIYELAPEPKEFWAIENAVHTEFMFRPPYQKKFYEYLDSNH